MQYGPTTSGKIATSSAVISDQTSPPNPSASTLNGAKTEIARGIFVSVLNLDSNCEVQSLGSGFVFRLGVIATNYHVIRGASRILVRRSGQDESFRASVVRVSERVDLALLQVDGLAVAPLELGKDEGVAVGDPVFAVGNPKGLEATFSDGLVSAKRTLDGVPMLQIAAHGGFQVEIARDLSGRMTVAADGANQRVFHAQTDALAQFGYHLVDDLARQYAGFFVEQLAMGDQRFDQIDARLDAFEQFWLLQQFADATAAHQFALHDFFGAMWK